MRQRILMLAFVFLTGCCCGGIFDPARPDAKGAASKEEKTTAKPIAKAGPTVWKADAELLNQLAPKREILPGYFMRLPKSFHRHKSDNLKATNMANWEGPGRADGHNTQLMIQIITVIDPKDKNFAPKTVLSNHLTNNTVEQSTIRKSPTEEGDLNGRTFIRGRSEGQDRLRKGSFRRDLAYIASDGNQLILISAHDGMSAKTDDFLGLAEAAILTFEKK